MDQKPKISHGTELLMKITGAFLDLLGALANLAGGVGSTVVNAIAYILFGTWFAFKGINPFKLKRAKTFVGTGLLELIPIVNILPGISRMVWVLIAKEKKTYQQQKTKTILRAKRTEEQREGIERERTGNIIRLRREQASEQEKIQEAA